MPVTPTVWVVPGYLGSHLEATFGPPGSRMTHVWLNHAAILACHTEMLREPSGATVEAFACLDNVTALTRHLAATRPIPIHVEEHPWDWRLNPLLAGEALAQRMRNAALGEAGTQYVVAHSMGGMVARWAWATLGNTGEQDLFARLVCIGTPHLGTYSAALGWTERQSSMNLIAGIKRGLANFPHPVLTVASELMNQQTYSLVSTWPGTYATLPPPVDPPPADDPLRNTVYNAATWAASYGAPPQAQLDWAREIWWHAMQLPGVIPPPSRMRQVVGVGLATPRTLVAASGFSPRALPGNAWLGLGAILRARRQGAMPTFETDTDGDGTVHRTSALRPGYESLVLLGEHSALPTHPALLPRIWGLILDPAPAPIPPPVEVDDPGMNPQLAPQELPHPAVAFRPCCTHPELCPR